MNLASKLFSSRRFWWYFSLSLSVSGWAQSRPFPNQDLSDIYQRLLPQMRKFRLSICTPTRDTGMTATWMPWP